MWLCLISPLSLPQRTLPGSLREKEKGSFCASLEIVYLRYVSEYSNDKLVN